MNLCLDLFLTYAKVGAMTFGGGYAMLPILKREMVDKKGWISEEELIDCYAIGQCTPGVIAVNAATLIGYRKKGIIGSICATVGVVTPPILIIITIASILTAFQDNQYVKHAFAGMNVAICAVIAVTVARLIKKTWIDLPTTLIGVCVFIASILFPNITTVIFVLVAAVVGIIINNLKTARKLKDESEGKK